jgi:DHA1 family tetracycline resistance protein-like MFS transporter
MKNTAQIPTAATVDQIPIFPILLVNFIGTLGYSIILPFLIILVIKFGGNEMTYGVMGATYSFFQLIGAPILGNWSDRYGRKKILLLSQAGTFLAWILFMFALLMPETTGFKIPLPILGAFAMSLPLGVLLMARALDGITGGNVSVANAYLADITSDKDRKRNFGKMAASANIGFIVGPAFAGVLGGTALHELLPVLAAMLISFVAIFVIAFMPESKLCTIAKPVDEQRMKKVFGQEHKECYKMAGAGNASFKDVLQLKNIPFILILYFAIFLAFNFFYVAFPVHAVQGLKWSLFKLGMFFSVLSLIMVCVQGPILSRISNMFSDSTLTLTGSVILAVGFFLFTSKSEALIFGGVLFFSVGNGIMWPSFLSILSKAAGDKYQGAVQGYASSAGSLASIIGLVAGGVVYGLVGVQTFLISGILILVIFVLSFKLVSVENSDLAAS